MLPVSNAPTCKDTGCKPIPPQDKPKRKYKPLAKIQPITRMLGNNSTLPETFDLSGTLSPYVKDQGKWESCTAFAACAALERLPRGGPDDQDQSERFTWYNAKVAKEISPAEDASLNLKDVIEALQVSGSCRESSCPYYDDQSDAKDLAEAPSAGAVEEALKNLVKAYLVDAKAPSKGPEAKKFYVYQRDMIKQILYFARVPVVISLDVTADTLNNAKDPGPAGRRPAGALKVPRKKEIANRGHAVLIVGYDEKMNMFKFRNSYGENWGDHGYGYIPFKYLERVSEFYVLYYQEFDPEKGSAAGSCMGSSSKAASESLPGQPLSEFFNIIPVEGKKAKSANLN